jgi:Lrp/AsnC family leucine-responsive transcriptional regulator
MSNDLPLMDLDARDYQLLDSLQRQGRITNAELAERVNLSPSACHRRMKQLEASGVIDGYVALLNARALGRATIVFVEITLNSQADEVLEGFEAAVRRIPAVLECHLMAGAADYLLKVCARDTDDFARIHRRQLARLPGVAQLQSSFSLRTVANTTALPLQDET